jgi:hypothetical protein
MQMAKPALLIFSDEQISAAVKLLKTSRPELWTLWTKLEVEGGDAYKELMEKVRTFVREKQLASSLYEQTALIREIRNELRHEIGLYVGPRFSEQEIINAVIKIKKKRPDLWERWKECEKTSISFSEIKESLKHILRLANPSLNSIEIHRLLFYDVRRIVRKEAGLL